MNVKMTLRRNSPKLLAILAAMGTVSTAFATARATPKALLLIQEAEAQKGEDLTALEKVKVAAVPYIPAAPLLNVCLESDIQQHIEKSSRDVYLSNMKPGILSMAC